MTVLVTGASGTLGRLVMAELAARGEAVRGMGRGSRPAGLPGEWARADLLTGIGLDGAMRDVRTVVHCASDPRRPADDVTALDHLIAAGRAADAHVLYVGIAGIEDAAEVLPYYRVKLACEARLADSGVPHTICRATQFHPFLAANLARLGVGPVQFCPAMRLQPVDPAYVASGLADLCRSVPQGRAPDLFGPETLATAKLVRPWLRANRLRRVMVPLPRVGVLSAWDRLRPAVGARGGGIRWRDWLPNPDG